jgi:hypothetical protein
MNRISKALRTVAGLAVWAAVPLLSIAQGAEDALASEFQNPPEAAWPRTWWHWTGGNVTKEGITKDLEWMKRVGIGGVQLADVSFGGGQTVEAKVNFWSPEWIDAVRHAAAEADRLGLEMTIFSSAGWSLTGGPWVKPEQKVLGATRAQAGGIGAPVNEPPVAGLLGPVTFVLKTAASLDPMH